MHSTQRQLDIEQGQTDNSKTLNKPGHQWTLKLDQMGRKRVGLHAPFPDLASRILHGRVNMDWIPPVDRLAILWCSRRTWCLGLGGRAHWGCVRSSRRKQIGSRPSTSLVRCCRRRGSRLRYARYIATDSHYPVFHQAPAFA